MYMQEELARRIAILHRVGSMADEQLMSIDPPLQPTTDLERMAVLRAQFFALQQASRNGDDPEDALFAIAVEAQIWLEAIERDRSQ